MISIPIRQMAAPSQCLADNVSYSWKDCAPEVSHFYPGSYSLLGAPHLKGEPLEQKQKDLARSVQAISKNHFSPCSLAPH